MSTFVITGGHHNSALVVAKEIESRGHKVVWIGHRYSSRGDTVGSAEYLEVTEAGIKFIDLKAAKMVLDLRELIRFPVGVYQAFQMLRKIKPISVISFGGYLGGSVALAGKVIGIPIFLHEQTVTAGRANKLIGLLAKKIYLTWQDSVKHFRADKTQFVGLPLRTGIIYSQRKSFFTRSKPTLLVMGGKQGAHQLNQFIFNHLSELLTHLNIIHQTGTSSVTLDYQTALAKKDSLQSLSDCYLPFGYIKESEIGKFLHSADFYLGRSGAHICYELAVIGLKSILVPLMSTHDREQYKNAKILEKIKLGIILSHKALTPTVLVAALKDLKQQIPEIIILPHDATKLLVDDLLLSLKK